MIPAPASQTPSSVAERRRGRCCCSARRHRLCLTPNFAGRKIEISFIPFRPSLISEHTNSTEPLLQVGHPLAVRGDVQPNRPSIFRISYRDAFHGPSAACRLVGSSFALMSFGTAQSGPCYPREPVHIELSLSQPGQYRGLVNGRNWAGGGQSAFDLLDVGSSCFPGELIAGIRVANGTTDNEGCPASAYMPSCGLRHFLTPEIIMSAHG